MSVVRELVVEAAPVFADRFAVAGTADTAGIAGALAVDWGGIEDLTPDLVEARRAAGRLTAFYVYGSPAHPNTLACSPAVEARMLPWIAAARGLDGLLRWSYNSWPADVFAEPVFVFSQGDEYLVYPGPDGPADSVRWDRLRAGIQDAELVRLLRAGQPAAAGTGDGGPVLRKAFELATRNVDGRAKDPLDMMRARQLVVTGLLSGADPDPPR
jgi:hypothetical protein